MEGTKWWISVLMVQFQNTPTNDSANSTTPTAPGHGLCSENTTAPAVLPTVSQDAITETSYPPTQGKNTCGHAKGRAELGCPLPFSSLGWRQEQGTRRTGPPTGVPTHPPHGYGTKGTTVTAQCLQVNTTRVLALPSLPPSPVLADTSSAAGSGISSARTINALQVKQKYRSKCPVRTLVPEQLRVYRLYQLRSIYTIDILFTVTLNYAVKNQETRSSTIFRQWGISEGSFKRNR